MNLLSEQAGKAHSSIPVGQRSFVNSLFGPLFYFNIFVVVMNCICRWLMAETQIQHVLIANTSVVSGYRSSVPADKCRCCGSQWLALVKEPLSMTSVIQSVNRKCSIQRWSVKDEKTTVCFVSVCLGTLIHKFQALCSQDLWVSDDGTALSRVNTIVHYPSCISWLLE